MARVARMKGEEKTEDPLSCPDSPTQSNRSFDDSISLILEDPQVSPFFLDQSIDFSKSRETLRQIRIFGGPATSAKKDTEENTSTRNVRFTDTTKNNVDKKDLPAGESVPETMASLQDRVLELQIELSAEKSMRKRKDRNLVKLAKELNRRISESYDKEVKVQEMSKTINELQVKAQNVCNENAPVLNENIPTSISRSSDGVTKPQSTRSTFLSVIVLVLSLAVAILSLDQRDLLSFDAVCAPIFPGSIVESGTFDAPWWAPDEEKANMFRMVCGSRLRSRISSTNNKISVSEISDDSSTSKVLWRGKAPLGVVVGSKSIDVKSKEGSTRFAAPWSL